VEKFAGNDADMVIMRIEAHEVTQKGLRAMFKRGEQPKPRVLAFTLVDYADKNGMTAMMRTTAWPASIVTQMLASGEVAKRGGVRQELDVPAAKFIAAMEKRGIAIEFSEGVTPL